MKLSNLQRIRFTAIFACFYAFGSCNLQIKEENYRKEITNGKVLYKKNAERGNFFLRYVDNKRIDSIINLGNGYFFELIDSATIIHKRPNAYILYLDNLNSDKGRYNDSAELIY